MVRRGRSVVEDETVLVAEVEWLNGAAVEAARKAAAARRLAVEIDRRRAQVVHRDDASVARHVPATWASQAATESRDELRRGVGFSLWVAGEALHQTRLALDIEAGVLEGDASSFRRRADLADDRLQATRSVSSTTLPG